MKILITGCFHSLNTGVMAMVESIIQQLPNDEIYVYTSPKYIEIDRERYSQYENVNLVIPPWYLSKKKKNAIIAVTALATGYIHDKKFRNFLSTIDRTYDISGDSISSDYGLQSSLLSLAPIAVSNRYTKESIIAPQSLGPFNHPVLRHFVKKVVGGADKVFIREPVTSYFLKPLGIKFKEVSDLANLVKEKKLESADFINESYVGIGVSSLLAKHGFENSESYFKSIIDQVLNMGHKVYLINHVSYSNINDLTFASDLKNKFYKENDNVIFFGENYTSSEWKYIYSKSKCVISARMHPTVLALSSGTPALNLSYNHKSLGVVKLKYSPMGDVFSHDGVESETLKDKLDSFFYMVDTLPMEEKNRLVDLNLRSASKVFQSEL